MKRFMYLLILVFIAANAYPVKWTSTDAMTASARNFSDAVVKAVFITSDKVKLQELRDNGVTDSAVYKFYGSPLTSTRVVNMQAVGYEMVREGVICVYYECNYEKGKSFHMVELVQRGKYGYFKYDRIVSWYGRMPSLKNMVKFESKSPVLDKAGAGYDPSAEDQNLCAVVASGDTPGTITVKWTCKADPLKREIKGFNIYYKDELNGEKYIKATSEPANGGSFKITGLKSNVKYLVMLTRLVIDGAYFLESTVIKVPGVSIVVK